jgi:hypothetical protein
MSTGPAATIIGALSNNSKTYHLPNPVHLDECTNYTITRQQVYPHRGRFGAKYPSAIDITSIGEDVGDANYRANHLGQLFMEDIMWASAIGVAKMVRLKEFGEFNTTLRDLLCCVLEDRSPQKRLPEGEVRLMHYAAVLLAQLTSQMICDFDYEPIPMQLFLLCLLTLSTCQISREEVDGLGDQHLQGC